MQRKITETDIKRSIKDYLILSGWFCFPIFQSLGSYKGIADLCACKNGITLWIEVKTKTGRQSTYQKRFEKNIKIANGHYVLARSYEDVDKYIIEKFGERSLLL